MDVPNSTQESKATVDDKGNANVTITEKNITDVIANAKAKTNKKGVTAGEITAMIEINKQANDDVQITASKINGATLSTEARAAIMDRYATAIGFKLPEVYPANTFADNAKIGAWSLSVSWS